MKPLKKIECPNCNTYKKGVLMETYENTKGYIRVKCKKCGAYVVYDATEGEYKKIENK